MPKPDLKVGTQEGEVGKGSKKMQADEGEPGPEGRVNNGDEGLEAVGWGRVSGEGEARGIVWW